MDAGFLNFHKEEDFSSYFLDPSEDSANFEDAKTREYAWEWEIEREHNGDIGLIPTTNIQTNSEFCSLSTSPPTNDEFHRIMSDWQNAIKLDHSGDDLAVDITICTEDDDTEVYANSSNFDLANYINEEDKLPDQQQLRLGGKRIDKCAQRYILDDEEEEDESMDDEDSEDDAVDVETLSDTDQASPLVLQATDVNTLLEQFEANENTNSKIELKKKDTIPSVCKKSENDTLDYINSVDIDYNHLSSLDIKEERPNFVEETGYLKPTPIDNLNIVLDKSEPIDEVKMIESNENMLKVVCTETKVPTVVQPVKDYTKQIMDSLPIELLERIRQSSKRKPIPVIPPIVPTKKRANHYSTTSKESKESKENKECKNSKECKESKEIREKDIVSVVTPTVVVVKTIKKLEEVEQSRPVKDEKVTVQLDHNYCSNTKITTRNKDSGFSSSGEEEERAIILRNQPTVKNADGTLMVSLLKSNTIVKTTTSSGIISNGIKKKKLNLEEYKKRLSNRSQTNSGQNSPMLDEDENTRRLRHQEMLMKMAYQVIKQQQKTAGGATTEDIRDNTDKQPKQKLVEIKQIEPPPNVVMKTLVSAGTNTEESWGHLEQILQNTNMAPITPNSLISSIVEHLPRIKPVVIREEIHGEDKTIVYIDKSLPKPEMCSVAVQTIRSNCQSTKTTVTTRRDSRQRQRRRSSSSSSSSRSRSSSSNSSSCAGRRSQRGDRDMERVVEERRVIYVGRIEDGITREELRRRFARFGPITVVSTHFRHEADNYGFVTFVRREDAYNAVERGNSEYLDASGNLIHHDYDLSFGGRRLFCQQTYSDLDRVRDNSEEMYWTMAEDCHSMMHHQQQLLLQQQQQQQQPVASSSFDALLREAQAKLRKRKL